MILKKCKQCLIIGIALLTHVQGRELPIEGAPPNGQPYIGQNGELDKNQYRSQLKALGHNSRVLKSQDENTFEEQKKRLRRDAISNNDKTMLQFDNEGSFAEVTIALNQSFTVCFAVMVEKLNADITKAEVFQWQSEDGDRDNYIKITANVYFGNILINDGVFNQPIALSTWKQLCYSSTKNLVVNGRVVENTNASPTLLGNTTLRFNGFS